MFRPGRLLRHDPHRVFGPVTRAGRRTPYLLGLLAAFFCALHLSWLATGWGGEAQRLFLGNVLFINSSFGAAAIVFAAALRQRGRVRCGWLLIGFGLAAQVVGDSLWGYFEVVAGTDPFPSAADLFYLLFGPFFAAGLVYLLPVPGNRLERIKLGLDVTITVGAVGLFFWRFLLAPPLTQGMDSWSVGVLLAYPLLDLLLLSLLLLIVLGRGFGGLPRPGIFLLAAGVLLQITADLFYQSASLADTYYTGHPLDAAWSASTLLFALAACVSLLPHPMRKQRVAPPRGWLVTLLPYLAVAKGFGLLLVTEMNPEVDDSLGARGVLYGVVVVTALVIVRQLLSLRENRRLTEHLEGQSSTLERRVMERTAELETLSARYRYDALHDALTGLPNRTCLQEQLRVLAAEARPFATLYLDFDHFKAVNDSFGHTVGDALLVALGERLSAALRPGDMVARLGGDEFAVLLTDGGEDAEEVAARLSSVFELPLTVGGHTLLCTASIGVVLSSRSVKAGNVLRDADIAMYRAKAAGRSQVAVFESAMREDVQARLALEADLRVAVSRAEFEVYYQPIVCAPLDAVVGVEALVRWHHPQRGLVSPDAFIAVAEETGLVFDIDRWVVQTACEQLARWPGSELSLSVNLSSLQFTRADLAPFLAEVLAGTKLAPHRLKLELTERLLLDTTQAVQETLDALRKLGVRLHIDDFGTGYSSLAYLQRFDADALKIDRSFVAMLETGSSELVQTIVNLAHNLGMQVVAEGVESKKQFVQLRMLGCDYMQGYLFSKPVPATDIEAVVRRPNIVAA